MPKLRLDQIMVKQALTESRRQAENYIKLGQVEVAGQVITDPAQVFSSTIQLKLTTERYVSRAALKLASAANVLQLNFKDKIILDVGSSTGGFTDYALRQGAAKVIAIDIGTDQLNHHLRADHRVELHEKTDIRNFKTDQLIELVLIDLSFISLRQILPGLRQLLPSSCRVVAMVKPQFEATDNNLKEAGVIKNDHMRRAILKDFEAWVSRYYVVIAKADSKIKGRKGNVERFYLLNPLPAKT